MIRLQLCIARVELRSDRSVSSQAFAAFEKEATIILEQVQISLQNITVIFMLVLTCFIGVVSVAMSPPDNAEATDLRDVAAGLATDRVSAQALRQGFHKAEMSMLAFGIWGCAIGIICAYYLGQLALMQASTLDSCQYLLRLYYGFVALDILWGFSFGGLIFGLPFIIVRWSSAFGFWSFIAMSSMTFAATMLVWTGSIVIGMLNAQEAVKETVRPEVISNAPHPIGVP